MKAIDALLFVLLLLVLASALALVMVRDHNRHLFIVLNDKRVASDHLRQTEVQLLLEKSVYTAEGYVDQVARHKLGMVDPDVADIIYITP